MATEVASAYVSLIPSFRGGAGKIAQELAGPATKAGRDAGEKGGKGLGAGLTSGVKGVAGALGGILLAGLALDKIKDVFAGALEQGAQTAKLGAQLGLTAAETAQAGKVTGKLYADNFGDSLEQVNEAATDVSRNIGASFSDADFGPITGKVLNLANTFDQDLGGTTAAVGQLIKTGLAKDATEALDLLTRGFQTGANKADDLLDTVTEYSTQFRKLGVDGGQAISLINQGLQAGARDGDLVADAIKEFSIRAVDGSDLTKQGFKDIGLSAGQMAERIGKGGKSANDALDLTLDRLRGIKDPVKQSQAAVALFGTQAEDLGAALFALDPSKAVDSLGQVGGAAKRMGDQLSGTPAAKLETFKRQLSQGFTTAAGTAIGWLSKIGGAITQILGPAFTQAKALFDAFLNGLQGGSAGGSGALVTLTNAGRGLRDAFLAISSFATGTLVPAFQQVWAFIQANVLPILSRLASFFITQVLPAVGAVASYVASKLVPIFKQVWAIIRGQVLPIVASFAKFIVGTLVPAVLNIYRQVASKLKPIFDQLVATFRSRVLPALQQLLAKFREYQPTIQKVISIVVKIIGTVLKFAAAILGKVLPPLIRFAGFLIGNVVRAVSTVIGWVVKIIGKVIEFGSKVVGAVQQVAKFVTGLKTKFNDALTFVRGIPGKIKSGLGKLGSLLYSAGQDIIRGLINGIKNMAGSAVRAAKGVVSDAVSGAKNLLGIHSPSTVFAEIGVNIGEGLSIGIESMTGTVAKSAEKLVTATTTATKKATKPAATGLRAAAAEVLAQLKKGGRVFEDFTFKGMSANLEKFHDQLADLFYVPGRSQSRSSLEEFLGQLQSGGATKTAPKLTGLQQAAAEVLRKLQAGGKVFEDFTFKGMSDTLEKFHQQLADLFYVPGRSQSRQSLEDFLRKLQSGGAGIAATHRPLDLAAYKRGETQLGSSVAPAVGDTINIYPRYAVMDEQRLNQTLHARDVRRRIGRPR